MGQVVGDGIAVIQGTSELVVGGAGEVGGTGLILTGGGAPVGIAVDVGSAAMIVHGGAVGGTGAVNLGKAVLTAFSGGSGTSKTGDATTDTIHGAQREAQRQEGIPTSQQPDKQVSTKAGRQYTYTVPKEGGGTQTKVVTRQHLDRNHGPHVEAGPPKPSGATDPSGRLRHDCNKSKINVKE
jgi:hypothetical protein